MSALKKFGVKKAATVAQVEDKVEVVATPAPVVVVKPEPVVVSPTPAPAAVAVVETPAPVEVEVVKPPKAPREPMSKKTKLIVGGVAAGVLVAAAVVGYVTTRKPAPVDLTNNALTQAAAAQGITVPAPVSAPVAASAVSAASEPVAASAPVVVTAPVLAPAPVPSPAPVVSHVAAPVHKQVKPMSEEVRRGLELLKGN